MLDDSGGSWLRRHRKFVIFAAVVAAVAVVFMPQVFGSRINNEECEMDLWSGRERITRHFLFCQVRQELKQTPFSDAIARTGPAATEERWVTTFVTEMGIGKLASSIWMWAPVRARDLERLWTMAKFDPEAQGKSARQLLWAMREGGSSYPSRDYMDLLRETLGPGTLESRTTAANQIPDDLADRALARRAERARKQQ